MASNLEILSLFGFAKDPFAGHEIESADGIRVRKLIAMTITAHAQLSLVGERGVGKTRAVNAAMHELKIKPVRILSPDKARVTAADIQEALLVELAPAEKCRHDREIRIRQLRRILGEESQKRPVVVVIEEAHRLNGNVLRSLKNLRELDWMGKTHLFAVILIGQSDCTQRVGLAEVRLRTETVQMHGLTQIEIAEYIRATVGRVFDEDAIAAIAALPDARNYLDLQALLVRCMSTALAAGRERVSHLDAAELVSMDVQDSPRSKAQDAAKTAGAVRSVLGRRQNRPGLKAVEERPA